MTTEMPTGTVTFLFTDLEGSTHLWEHYPDAMRHAMARHDAILRDAVTAHAGYLVKTTGDGVHAAFGTAADAVDAAIAGQLALRNEQWDPMEPLRVRMGMHTGVAEVRGGDYYGGTLNRAARLMAIAHGDQIVLSIATAELVRDDGYELLDLGEHRLRDLGRPEHVFQVVHTELAREFAALKSLESFPTNLPLQTTSFVGRSREIDDVAAALDAHRVITMTGVGGVGKTRLALQVGSELLPRYRDGVWLCELGPLGNAQLVPTAIARALGVQPRPGQSTTESVVAACERRELLVVLDNCEHLLDAAAQMVDAIERACPAVRVLATSREGLGVSGERIMVLRSLVVPTEDVSPDDAVEIEAVRLFVERAAAVREPLTISPDNVDAIVQICRRLDGIPLAIELAAARARMMSPAEIASRLDERFRLLTGGSRTTVERHQTLRQAVDWSYDLLAARERRLLNRLAVFAGGFTLEAADAVAGNEAIDAFEVLDGLGQLVDKSLMVAQETGDGTRYRLLETIRQYGLDRLDESGETDEVRKAHALWIVAFAARVAAGTRGADLHLWTGRLVAELDNIRAALTWAVERREVDLAASMLSPFYWFFLYSSVPGYALAPWAATVLAMEGAARLSSYPALLALRALDHLHHDRLPDAIQDAEHAIVAVPSGSTFSVQPWVALFMSHVTAVSSPSVADRCEECLRAARASGSDFELASALLPVTATFLGANRLTEARACAEEGAVVARRSGNPTLIGIGTNLLAVLLFDEDPDRALALLHEGLDASEQPWVGNLRGTALVRLARLERSLDEPEWASTFRIHLARVQDAGDRRAGLILLELYSRALAECDHYEVAAVLRGALPLGDMFIGNVSADERQRCEDAIRRGLGDTRAEELRRRGAAMDVHDAMSIALAELDRVIAGG